MKIIKPILESLGYDDFDYESDRSDIFVPEKILLEAKNHNISLDKFVSQLEGYWNKKKTRFAILCNGIEFRVYHPSWTGKKFEETLIKQIKFEEILFEEDFLINCLSNYAINTGKAKQKLREIEDFEEMENKKCIEKKERKIEIESQLKEVEIEKNKQIDKINELYSEKISSLRNEQFQIEAFLNVKKSSINIISPIYDKRNIVDSVQTDSMKEFSRVEVLDKANYYGLIEGKQIMFCTTRKQGEYMVLWCKDNKSKLKHMLSFEGQKFSEHRVFNDKSSFIGKITYLFIAQNNLNLWTELYEEKLFPFWDPKLGPFKFNSEHLKRIAICQVLKTNIIIDKSDFGSGETSRLLKNPEKIEQLKNGLKNMSPVLTDQEFLDKKIEIERIVNKYQ